MGKPVIHSAVGGAKEMIVAGRNGDLFGPGDTKALVNSLAGMAVSGMAKGMGANARTVVETRFSEKSMVDRYESLLLDICSKFLGCGDVAKRHAIWRATEHQ